MSEVETHSGQIKIISTNDEDTKKFIKEHLNEWWTIREDENGWEIDETEAYYEKYWKQGVPFDYEALNINGEKWLIKYIKHKKFDEYEPIEEISINSDGTYDFLTQFYNGGTYLAEMLGEMIEKKILKQ